MTKKKQNAAKYIYPVSNIQNKKKQFLKVKKIYKIMVTTSKKKISPRPYGGNMVIDMVRPR